jgi:hypothetical protein
MRLDTNIFHHKTLPQPLKIYFSSVAKLAKISLDYWFPNISFFNLLSKEVRKEVGRSIGVDVGLWVGI